MQPLRKQREDRGEDRRDHGAAAEALDDSEEDEDGKAAARRAAGARQGEAGNRDEKEQAQREKLGQPAGQRDGDDLGDEIGGLDPAQPVERDDEPGLDVGQRAGDDLDVENGHEHAEAHGEVAEPGGAAGLGAADGVALIGGFGHDVTRRPGDGALGASGISVAVVPRKRRPGASDIMLKLLALSS